MASLVPIIFASFIVALAVLAAMSLFRGLLRSGQLSKARFAAIKPVNPPEPFTVRTAGVELVGWVGIVWATAHLAILVVWAMALATNPSSAVIFNSASATGMTMACILVATIITGCGSIMILRLMSYGRRMIAWGLMLFGVMAAFGFALCLILRTYVSGPFYDTMQKLAIPLAILLACHVILDTALGTIAQHVAKGVLGDENKEAAMADKDESDLGPLDGPGLG
ncbi:MAG: hypothetical protein WC869_03395 [Phycisphaerae bacterium]|jgi:hypothetical protein